MDKILLITSVFFYAVVFFHQGASLCRQWRCPHAAEIVLGFLAVASQAWLLHHWIDVGSHQNLSLTNMLVLIVWMVAVLAWLLNCLQPLGVFWLVIAPLAIATMVLRVGYPMHYAVNIAEDPASLIHVLLAVLLVGVVLLTGLCAWVLYMQQRSLKHMTQSRWLQRLPALESMEHVLTQLLLVGFILLTLMMGLSWYYFHAEILTSAFMLQKLVALFAAWSIFALALVGRLLFGWRGLRAVVSTSIAMILLLIVYLIS